MTEEEMRELDREIAVRVMGRDDADLLPWSPTHDWAAAGEVIERLSKLGISVQFESFVWDEPHRFRKCHLFKGDNAPSHVMTYDPDMRVALCRGALSMMIPTYPTTEVARHE